jgi:transcriptional regulator with PAS, ATPase and Fis domain
MESVQNIKQRFEIIGNDRSLIKRIEKPFRSSTDITVLVAEKAVGKENIPRIIHSLHRKHGKYIANCGAIPEGTIDSELFGHEKALYWSNRHS